MLSGVETLKWVELVSDSLPFPNHMKGNFLLKFIDKRIDTRQVKIDEMDNTNKFGACTRILSDLVN